MGQDLEQIVSKKKEMEFALSLLQKKVNVLIASSHRMLGESLQAEVEKGEGCFVMLTNARNFELLTEIEIARADVLIILSETTDVPGIVSHIFDVFPGIITVVLNQATGEAVLCKQVFVQEAIPKIDIARLIQNVQKNQRCSYWGTHS